MMANREVLGLALGVGSQKITAARVMMGQVGTRKMFIGPLKAFFQKHPNFRIQDAATPESREAFLTRATLSLNSVAKCHTRRGAMPRLFNSAPRVIGHAHLSGGHPSEL